MSFGRRNLRLKFERGVATPKYLDPNRDGEIVGEVIRFYEGSLGRKLGEIDWKLLLYIVGDDRLAEGLRHVMRTFYKPKPPPKILKKLREVRREIFKYVNERYGGYISSKVRSEALRDISKKYRLPVNVSDYLWLDEVESWKLERVKKPTVADVVKTYNLEVVDTLATNSSKLKLEYRGVGSEIPKILGRKCKFLGLIYEGKQTLDGKVEFEILGPRALYGKSAKYGSRITRLILELSSKMQNLDYWRISFEVRFPKRTLEVLVASHNFRPELPHKPTVKVREIFDSKIEERIYWALKSLGLKVHREPDPIISKSMIYIPDFRVDVGDSKIYVEVVGYWRKEYLEKKVYKLAEASKTGLKLVVIADEKAKNYVEKLDLPITYYTLRSGRPILPYGNLVRIIRG